MTENESSKFKIRQDDNPESQFQDEIQDLQVDKLSKRLTLITILIPCLVGVILYLAYRDIQTRVGQVSVAGTANVKTLSKGLEKRLSSLSKKQKDLEKGIAATRKENKEADTAIRYIRTARKADNKKSLNAINSIDKTLATLATIPPELENMAAYIKLVDEKLGKELNHFSQSIEGVNNNLIKIQAEIVALGTVKIDHKALDTALRNQQEAYQRSLELTKRELNMKIASLENKLKKPPAANVPTTPKKQAAAPKTTTSSTPAAKPAPKSTPSKAAVSKPAAGDEPTQSSSLPKPGTFIEQDVK